MNIVSTVNETTEGPGQKLARIREEKGYTKEFVAAKLHLRVKIIELLEADDYEQLPEAVFIKGYLRAYAKLLGSSTDTLVSEFNNRYIDERSSEKTLWQSSRPNHLGQGVVRWLSFFFFLLIVTTLAFWWYQNKDKTTLSQSTKKELDVFAKQDDNPHPSSHRKQSAKKGLTSLEDELPSTNYSYLQSFSQIPALELPREG